MIRPYLCLEKRIQGADCAALVHSRHIAVVRSLNAEGPVLLRLTFDGTAFDELAISDERVFSAFHSSAGRDLVLQSTAGPIPGSAFGSSVSLMFLRAPSTPHISARVPFAFIDQVTLLDNAQSHLLSGENWELTVGGLRKKQRAAVLSLDGADFNWLDAYTAAAYDEELCAWTTEHDLNVGELTLSRKLAPRRILPFTTPGLRWIFTVGNDLWASSSVALVCFDLGASSTSTSCEQLVVNWPFAAGIFRCIAEGPYIFAAGGSNACAFDTRDRSMFGLIDGSADGAKEVLAMDAISFADKHYIVTLHREARTRESVLRLWQSQKES